MQLKRPEIGASALGVLVAIYLLAVANLTFWSKAWNGFENGAGFFLFAGAALALFIATLVGLSFKYVTKPLYIFVILSAITAAYFTDTFGTIINANMIENVVSTNSGEAGEYLTTRFCLWFLALGLVPSFFIAWVQISYGPFRRRLLSNLATFLLMGVVASALILSNFRQVTAALRKDHAMMETLNPSGPVSAAVKVAAAIVANLNTVREPYGRDASRGPWIAHAGKPVVLVVVAGEAARAMNFSLNGYARRTNPELERRDVLNFSNVTSCGTETSISIRCMFSGYTRKTFSKSKAMARESLMDVFSHAGMDVHWWDNDGGSKGVADNVKYISYMVSTDPAFCRSGTCQDGIMLKDLDRLIGSASQDTVIVLHQRGSHGPAYYLRYPDTYGPFKPDCRLEQVTDCSTEEVVNAYDNTIAYTDEFLAAIIDILSRRQDRISGAMFYVSDHGESLGENGIYMHGAPYSSAPAEQTRIPLIAWLSRDYENMSRFDRGCALGRSARPYSHDNVYHTLLGMMNIETSVYKPELDMFKECRDG